MVWLGMDWYGSLGVLNPDLPAVPTTPFHGGEKIYIYIYIYISNEMEYIHSVIFLFRGIEYPSKSFPVLMKSLMIYSLEVSGET